MCYSTIGKFIFSASENVLCREVVDIYYGVLYSESPFIEVPLYQYLFRTDIPIEVSLSANVQYLLIYVRTTLIVNIDC